MICPELTIHWDLGTLPEKSENARCLATYKTAEFPPHCSKKEKQDVDELDLPDTKALFLESGASLEDKKAKEMQEYLDAVNKEVIYGRGLNVSPFLAAATPAAAAAPAAAALASAALTLRSARAPWCAG